MQQVLSLLNDSGFWNALLALVLAVVFVPGGVAQQVLTGLGGALERWAQKRLPANEYNQLKTLGEDAVRSAWQLGTSLGWDNATKKEKALAEVTAAAKGHGIDLKRWDPQVLGAILESVWIDVKQQLIQPVPSVPTPEPSSTPSAPTSGATAIPSAVPGPSFVAGIAAVPLGTVD